MLTQQNFDAVSAANYLDNYLECLETLPDKIQRHVSEIRRLDAQYYDGINKIQELRREFLQICLPPPTSSVITESATTTVKEQKRTILQRVKYLLAQGQIISDEKLKQIASMYELLEQKWRSLDQDGKVLDFDCSESLLKPQSNGTISRSSPIHPSKILDHDSIGINGNLVLRSERRQAIEESDSPTIVASASSSSSTRQGSNSNHKRARRQKQFPDFVRETDVGTNEPQATTSRRDRTSASVASTTSSTATTATVTPATTSAATTASAAASSTSSGTSATATSNSKRRRKLQSGANSGGGGAWNSGGSSSSRSTKFNVPVEPDEPTYCLCEQVSYGEMIGCDNTDCEIEWFHFNCVSLSVKPKGKWFCPNCRGERSNVMKE